AGVVSAAVIELTRQVLKTMAIQNLALASGVLVGAALLTWGASATLGRQDQEPPAVRATAPRKTVAAATPASGPEPNLVDATETFPVRGRVLDPNSKPIENAEIHVTHHRAAFDWNRSDPRPDIQRGRVAVAGKDGQFHFPLDKSSSDSPYAEGPAWH